MKKITAYQWNQRKRFFLFLTPLTVFLVLFTVLPVLGTVYSSFFQDVVFLPFKWYGFGNYAFLLSDPGFWQAFRFTLLFIAVAVPLEMILGLIFALVLNETIPGRGFLRAAALLPWVIPLAISARTWELIYNYHFGLANYLMMKFGLSPDPINWLGTGWGAFFALVLSDAWKTAPFVAVILLAGMQAIPRDLYAQSRVDGAGLFQRFRWITLPLIRNSLVIAILFRTIDTLRIFDLVYVLTGGGPGGTTQSLSLYSYSYYLMGDFGYGSAISIILFLAALALSVLLLKLSHFKDPGTV